MSRTLPRPLPAVERGRGDSLRTVRSLMAFRVGLATLLLGGLVLVGVSAGGLDGLGSPFSLFGFGAVAATYVASLAYALAFARVRDPVRFAYAQIAIDLVLITVVVHATGGGQSGFCFLYLVDVVAAALLARRRGAAAVAGAGAALMIGVAVLGYWRVLPLLPGQLVAPWEIARGELATKLALDIAVLVAVGVLASALAAKSRQADERLTRHEAYAGDLAQLHENTIRCLTSGLITLGPDGCVTTANDAACDILGAEAARLRSRPLAELMPDLPRVLAEAGPAGTVRRAEVDAVRPDGSARHLGISAAPLSDHSGRIIGRVIHFQDLTELKRMELAVVRAERLASVGRLAAGIAHEIRNPLASISGSIQILRDAPGADPDGRALMDIAVREVDRLNALVTSLLDYARPPTEERRRVDLGEEVAEIVRAFEQERRDARAAIAVHLEIAPAAAVHGAGGQLRQVVWNLLRNAAEAMPSGGTLAVSVRREESAAGGLPAAVGGGGPAPQVVLSVSDTGVGIPRSDLDRIFEPFFTTKSSGTGLGLPTVARIVDDHRGTVEIGSEIGRGTIVTVRLPAAPEQQGRVVLAA